MLSISPEAQVLLGTSVYTRGSLKDNPRADFATLATTVLFPYVKWLINKSLALGLTRLYFIARDGYVLKEIADIIIEQDNIENLKTHYIYGSRDAWRMPCVAKFEDMSFVFSQFINRTTISYIAERYGITTNELQKFLKGSFKKENKILTVDNLTTIKSMLNTPEFVEFILNKNKEKRELLIEYLRQNIDFSDENFAFVDLTCSGTTNYLLSNLINDNFNDTEYKLKFFNIRISKNLKDSNFMQFDFLQLHFEPIIIEIFARAPHGLTIGYENKEGKIEPILNEAEKFENFKDYIEAIKFQTKLLADTLNTNSNLNLYKFSIMLTDSIKSCSTKDTAKYFSSVEFSSVGTSKEFSTNKDKFNLIDILNIFYFKKIRPDQKQIDFVLKNSNILVQSTANFFTTHPKLNIPQIKHSLKHTKIAIKSNF